MKALIITYYWPPAGGSGVQRWLYFVKYLRDFGIEPVVFTVANPNYPIVDPNLDALIPKDIEVIRQKIWEPNNFLGKRQKKTGAGFLPQKPTFLQKIAQYIRANYFIPDARKFWIKPSAERILKYLSSNKIDWIITTGPPHSVHLIGKAIKEQTNSKWLADFRDPWTEIDYFHRLPLTKKSLQKHKILEHAVISKADIITVVSANMLKSYKSINPNCHIITNGYDGEIALKNEALDSKFSLAHIGLLNADRNPHIFWKTIRKMIAENPDFKKKLQINLIGKIADEVQKSIATYKLEKYISIIDYLPHSEMFSYLKKSQVLLLFVNDVPSAKGIVTGKVFEYLRALRPILAIAPTKGDLSNILNYTKAGKVVDFQDMVLLENQLAAYFDAFSNEGLKVDSRNIENYQRKNLSKQLALLLKNN